LSQNRAVPDANSIFNNTIDIPRDYSVLPRAVPDTNSIFNDAIGAPLVTAKIFSYRRA
jgi:hypothetical protein